MKAETKEHFERIERAILQLACWMAEHRQVSKDDVVALGKFLHPDHWYMSEDSVEETYDVIRKLDTMK